MEKAALIHYKLPLVKRILGFRKPITKAVQTYEQAFQGLFTTGTSASASGKPKKRSVAKLGLKTIVHLRPCLSSTTLPGTNR